MSDSPFWMVWNPNGHAPTYAHHTKAAAVAEAERLARGNRGQTFFVLQALSKSVSIDIKTTTLGDGVPF